MKRTKGADSHEPAPVIHKSDSLDLILSYSVTPRFPDLWLPIGDFGGGRERPPYFASRIGTAGLRNLHSRGTPGRVAPVPLIPGGKAFGTTERGRLPPAFGNLTRSDHDTGHRFRASRPSGNRPGNQHGTGRNGAKGKPPRASA